MEYKKETIFGATWIIDENNNRVSIQGWLDEETAKKQLESLTDCSDCSECSGCIRCIGCRDCGGCSDCSGCSRCIGCRDCSDCIRCGGCSDCSDCIRCIGCSDCIRCSGCSDLVPTKQTKFEIPKIENIHKKVYEAATQTPESFDMRDWHTCETTHCRAGWVVHLAGEAGRELEKRTSTLFAAMQIYKESGYLISPVRFYDLNNAALEDMKRLAEES